MNSVIRLLICIEKTDISGRVPSQMGVPMQSKLRELGTVFPLKSVTRTNSWQHLFANFSKLIQLS